MAMDLYSDADGRLSESKIKAFTEACAKFSIDGFKHGLRTFFIEIPGFKAVVGGIYLEKMATLKLSCLCRLVSESQLT